jgi:hypothetical protein
MLKKPFVGRLQWTISQSQNNTAEVEIFKEDHTVGNLIRQYVSACATPTPRTRLLTAVTVRSDAPADHRCCLVFAVLHA